MNEYDGLIQEEKKSALRQSLYAVGNTQPDTEAKLQSLATRTGLPLDAVRLRQPEVELHDRLNSFDYTKTVQDAPKLANWMANPKNASIAHDDVENLTAVERAIRSLGGAAVGTARYITSADNKGGFLRDMGAGVQRANRGAAGVFQSAAELVAPVFDPLAGTVLPENPLRRVAQGFADMGARSEGIAKSMSPASGNVFADGVSSGVQSLTSNLLTLPMALLPGGAGAAMTAMVGSQGGQSYQDAREKGLTAIQALPYAASQAAIEYATEKLPLAKLIGDLKAGSSFAKTLANNMAREIPGEQVATILQDLNEWAVLKPNAPFSEYIAERPSAAAQTLIATVIGAGGQVTVMRAIQNAFSESGQAEDKQTRAESSANAADELSKLVTASKLNARSSDQFMQFVQEVSTEDGTPKELFVDGDQLLNTLNQSGITMEQLAMVAPTIAGQLRPDTFVPGSDIRVPVSEFMAADPSLTAPLIDYMRDGPDAMNRIEAKEFLTTQGPELQAAVEREIGKQDATRATDASIAEVQTFFESQLNAVGTFRPEVNSAYANMLGNFYATQAARAGMKPMELMDKYRLRVSDKTGGGQTLEQGGFAIDNTISAKSIRPINPVEDKAKFTALVENMKAFGWQGRPVLAWKDKGVVKAITGSHRIAAARKVGIDVPVLFISKEAQKWDDPNGLFSTLQSAIDDQRQGNFLRAAGDKRAADLADAEDTGLDPSSPNTLEQAARAPLSFANDIPSQSTPQTETPAFKNWFGDSKVVDAEGAPLVVYHSSPIEDLGEFAASIASGDKKNGQFANIGLFLSRDKDVQDAYSSQSEDPHAVYVKGRLFTPANEDTSEVADKFLRSSQGREMLGYDPVGEDEFDSLVTKLAEEMDDGDLSEIGELLESPDFVGWLYEEGYEGVDTGENLLVFDPKSQLKSATDNSGAFDPSNPNILEQDARATLSFANDITQAPSVIALLEGANLSSFLHETGHFFLEVQADLASRIQARILAGEEVSAGEQGIVDDMNIILKSFGIEATPEFIAIQEWQMRTLEERREAHETFARSFERFAMEGKAPGLELQSIFSKFRSWLLSVYKNLTDLNVNLSDDVRGVMGRMLASDQAIQEASDARGMGPLYETPEQAGMTPEEFGRYQALGEAATSRAATELDARLLKDMKWLSRARSKAIKEAQAEANDLRREVMNEVRAEVMAQPVYQAWQILKGKGMGLDDRFIPEKAKGRAKTLNPAEDNLFEAIAKLGGMDRETVKSQWGVEDRIESGVFGTPVLRKSGGASIDSMAEYLVENGYLLPDSEGKADIAKFEELFDDQRRGVDRFSLSKEYSQSQDDAPIEGVDLTQRYAKLNTTELKRRYGEKSDAVWRTLSERGMTNNEGMDPDILAESIPGGGFDSGDQLVRELAAARPPAEVIQEQTDQRMLEKYGDITSADALRDAADVAVHNELRARVIAAELKALEKAGNVREGTGNRSSVDVLARAAKEYAVMVVSRQRVRDIRPSQYTAAEARSSRLARASMGKDLAESAKHKQNQLINNYAAKAAFEALGEVKSMQTYFRKFDKRSKTIDPEYIDQIEQLLETYDFRPISLKAIDKRKSFAAWYADQSESDNPPDVPDALVQQSGLKSYKDMTMEELRGLRDAVKQLEHQGRLKNKLLLARDKRTFNQAADQIAASIVANGGEARPIQLEGPNDVVDWFAGVVASHRKLSSYFRQMDGSNDSGPMFDLIGRSMNERGAAEDVANEKATIALQALYAPLMKMRGGITGFRSKLFIPEINASLTRGGRLAVALNWGNEANRQRVMDGDKWSAGQVNAIMKTLSVEELTFVNKAWEYIDSLWPDVAAKQKRLTGVVPEKVEAVPFTQVSSDGTEVAMRGGYYPLKYDSDRSDRASQQEAAQVAKEMMQGAMTRATTRRDHTRARVKEVNRAVRKNLNVITQHVTEVNHDLTWHEWLIDTNKFLQDSRIVDAIRSHYGPKVLKTMRDGVMAIAGGDLAAKTDVDKALLVLRSNVTRATMGASITTAFLQPFGLTQSMVRIGPKHVLRGLARWGGDAAKMESTVGWIQEKSDFMRLRSKTFNKELREIRGAVNGKSKTMTVIDAGLFSMMQKMQMVADVPTWVGQYEKTISEGPTADTDTARDALESRAIAMADRAVLESQGGGQLKDLAEVQRKHPMLTQFYSYFSVTLNLAAEQTAATKFKNPAAVAGWLGDMALLLVIPAILPALIMFLLKGGDSDDEKGLARRILEWQLGYLMSMVVGIREFGGAISGFDYAGPPVGRIVGDIGKAGKQTAQGEVDDAAVMSYIQLMGTAFGIPVTQILRSYKGWKAWDEGNDKAGPQSVLFGPPPKD